MTRRAASGSAGFSKSTLYRMLEEDDGTLRDAIESAEADAEATYTSVVAMATPHSWQAAAWWLERRKHEDYALRQKVDMSIDIRRAAEKVAEEAGLDPETVLAEANRILEESRT
jgi:hypothetical protein